MIAGMDLLEALPVALYATDAEGRITLQRGGGGALGPSPELGSLAALGASIGPTGGLCRMTSARWP
jgi:hypothetical protein